MADIVLQRDLLSLTQEAVASARVSATAGGTGDNTAVTGLTIDRSTYGIPLTSVFSILVETVLAAAATLSILAPKIEHSADGSTWTTYLTPTAPGVVATGPGGGGTVRAVVRVGVNLSSAMRYVRFVWTPDLSASGTDTASLMASVTLAGTGHLPPP